MEQIMTQWDYWRAEIAKGNKGSSPRDWFESVIDDYESKLQVAEKELEKYQEVIKQKNREIEKVREELRQLIAEPEDTPAFIDIPTVLRMLERNDTDNET